MLANDAILEKVLDLKRKGVAFALATVVRCEAPTSAKPGAKAIIDDNGEIDGWIGGGCAQPAVIATAEKALQDGRPRLIRIGPKGVKPEEGVIDFGMTCHSGGILDIFIEPVRVRPALLIMGDAPSAQVLSVLANRVGFAVTSACPGADTQLFPEATAIIDGFDPGAIAAPAFVVVATQGKQDEAALEAALASGAQHILFIASERKAKKLRDYLKERGLDPETVNAIISPAGIDIGAVTPEEIALSVLAAVVKLRRATEVDTGSCRANTEQADKKTDCCQAQASDRQLTAGQGTAIDPVCGMSIDMATTKYKSDYRGLSYYFCGADCLHNFEKTPEQYLPAGEATT